MIRKERRNGSEKYGKKRKKDCRGGGYGKKLK